MAFAIRDRLLRRAAQIDRPHNRAILCIDNRDIWRTMAKHVHPATRWITQNAVWPTLHINGLDRGQRLRVPHRDRLAAAEAMLRPRVNCVSMRTHISNLAYWLQRIQIVDGDPARGPTARHIEFAAGVIGIHIVKSTLPANFRCLQYLVRPSRLCPARKRHHCHCSNQRKRSRSHVSLLQSNILRKRADEYNKRGSPRMPPFFSLMKFHLQLSQQLPRLLRRLQEKVLQPETLP